MKKSKCRAIAALLCGICAGGVTVAVAGNPSALPDQLSGLISDYTPGTVSGGPYEMRGEWSLDIHRRSQTASFSAVMNMETSDWGAVKGIVDPDDPSSRKAHTHHITMTNATVTRDTSVCPSLSPATSGGFVVTGTVHITGNGTPAPFESGGKPPSTAQICVTGGSKVELSNITLTLSGLATGHFGTQAIHGVVSCTWPHSERPQGLCGGDKSHSHEDAWSRSRPNGGWSFDDDGRYHSHDPGNTFTDAAR